MQFNFDKIIFRFSFNLTYNEENCSWVELYLYIPKSPSFNVEDIIKCIDCNITFNENSFVKCHTRNGILICRPNN